MAAAVQPRQIQVVEGRHRPTVSVQSQTRQLAAPHREVDQARLGKDIQNEPTVLQVVAGQRRLVLLE